LQPGKLERLFYGGGGGGGGGHVNEGGGGYRNRGYGESGGFDYDNGRANMNGYDQGNQSYQGGYQGQNRCRQPPSGEDGAGYHNQNSGYQGGHQGRDGAYGGWQQPQRRQPIRAQSSHNGGYDCGRASGEAWDLGGDMDRAHNHGRNNYRNNDQCHNHAALFGSNGYDPSALAGGDGHGGHGGQYAKGNGNSEHGRERRDDTEQQKPTRKNATDRNDNSDHGGSAICNNVNRTDTSQNAYNNVSHGSGKNGKGTNSFTQVKPTENDPSDFHEEKREIGDDTLPEFADHGHESNQFQGGQNGDGQSNSKSRRLNVGVRQSRMKM